MSLKRKAMLETASFIIGIMLASLGVNLLVMYGHLLPFTMADFGLFLSVLTLFGLIYLMYKLRLEALERKAALAENNRLQ